MNINILTGDQLRQLIDTRQAWETYREADRLCRTRFQGSMRWVDRDDRSYLLRKTGSSERSLGPRSQETEATFAAFVSGKRDAEERRDTLAQRLDTLAPVNRAMGLGRIPQIAARILRRCDERGVLGEHILVIGTNALYAYEAAAGVRLSSDLIATADIDFLLDARRRLKLAAMDIRAEGLLGLLRQTDRSFAASTRSGYRAANKDGYIVEIVRPEPRDVFGAKGRTRLAHDPGDLEGAPLAGLDWLINTAKFSAIAIDERGHPTPISVPDPRAFALHKLWVSTREDRDPARRRRDLDHARVVARIASVHLGLSFDDKSLDAIPASLRKRASSLLEGAG